MEKRKITLLVMVIIWLGLGPFVSTPAHGTEIDSFSATLTDFWGEVSIQKPDEKIWLPVEINMPLEEGDLLRTGPGALAEILIDDGSLLKVEENTEIALDELSADSETKRTESTIFLKIGRLISNIVKFTYHGSRFDIETPTMVAGVRGTEFVVETADSEKTDVGVFEGEVAVTGFDEQGELADESEVIIRKGHQTTVLKNRRPLSPVALKRGMLLHRNKVALLKIKAAKRRLNLQKIIGKRSLVHGQVLKKWHKFKLQHPKMILKPQKKIEKMPRHRKRPGRRR